MATLTLSRFLPYRLSIASNRVSEAIATAYEAMFGLNIPEWRLIAVIAEAGPISQRAIGRMTRMDKMTVSRAAAALAQRRLVERAPNDRDGRSHLLSLTAAGRALHAEIAPKALELEARIFGGFGEEELRGFVAMLERIEAAVAALDPQSETRPA